MKSTLLLPVLGFAMLVSACQTTSQNKSPKILVTQDQMNAWMAYTRVSPLSTNGSPSADAIRAKASSILPAAYITHIQRVATWTSDYYAANRQFEREAARITGSQAAATQLSDALIPFGFKVMRELNREEDEGYVESKLKDWGNDFFAEVSKGLAQYFIEENRKAQLRSAYVTILDPIYRRGAQLVFAEYDMGKAIGVEPTAVISDARQKLLDQDLRRVLPGVWNEGAGPFYVTKLWGFYGNGSFVSFVPITSNRITGSWKSPMENLFCKRDFTNSFTLSNETAVHCTSATRNQAPNFRFSPRARIRETSMPLSAKSSVRTTASFVLESTNDRYLKTGTI